MDLLLQISPQGKQQKPCNPSQTSKGNIRKARSRLRRAFAGRFPPIRRTLTLLQLPPAQSVTSHVRGHGKTGWPIRSHGQACDLHMTQIELSITKVTLALAPNLSILNKPHPLRPLILVRQRCPDNAFQRYTRSYISNTIQYNTIQYNTIQYNAMLQYNAIQYNTIQYLYRAPFHRDTCSRRYLSKLFPKVIAGGNAWQGNSPPDMISLGWNLG
jgi:hypothetical protein